MTKRIGRNPGSSKCNLRWPVALSLVVGLLALLWLANSGRPASSALGAAGPPEVIGAGIVESLQAEGRAQVVVALGEGSQPPVFAGDMAAWTADVAALQAGVLSAVDASDFALKNRYQAVPALAGVILSERGLAKLVAQPAVVRIDLDAAGGGALGDSVPHIGADTWAGAGIDGSGVVVAVLDSGLDTEHSDLAAGLIHEACFLDGDGLINGVGLCPNGSDRQIGPGAAEDDAGHGTHVTGIVGSRGNRSAPGVAPGANFVAIKVSAGPSFSGTFYYFSEIVAALDYIIMVRTDVQVINMSLVTDDTFPGNCDNSTSWLMAGAAAINTLRANGVVAFASSGNTSSGTHMAAPACLSNVLSVGATDLSDIVAGFTSSNSTTDLMAPGVGIVSSAIGNGTTTASGTSMASPHAAGCAALFLQAGVVFTPDDIESRLEDSAYQVTDATNGLTFPRIDCTLTPVTAADLTGPISGETGVTYEFTTSVAPITASKPIVYRYDVTGYPVFTHVGGLSDVVSLSWSTGGAKTIEVTVHNGDTPVSDVHQIRVIDPDALSISRWSVAGGGGVSNGGGYRLSGTAGQPDAQGPSTGGGFQVSGGFWPPAGLVWHPVYLPVMMKP